MQPFTFDQSVIAGLLFLLGLLIGMFFMVGGKWKRRYRAEAARADELERENARLGGQVREYESLRHAAARAPVGDTHVAEEHHGTTTVAPVHPAEPYARVEPDPDVKPDIVVRRP